jgi:hypothetical protein
MKRHDARRLAPIIVAVLVLSSCAGNAPPNVTPQAQVAHAGAQILTDVTAFQQFIIQASSGPTPVLPVKAALPIMDAIRGALLTAQQLSAALKVYDAAVPGAEKQGAAARVQQLLDGLSQSGLTSLAASLPPSLLVEGTQLAGNVAATVATVRASLAAAQMGGR